MGRVLPIPAEGDRVVACNICGGLEHGPVFGGSGREFLRCRGCGLVFAGGAAEACQSANAVLDRVSPDPRVPAPCENRQVVRQHLRILRRAVGAGLGLRLLVIGSANRQFLSEALRSGCEADGPADDWRGSGYADACFDVVALFDGLGRVRDPLGELVAIRRLLRPGGWLLLSAPNIDGLLPRLSRGFASRYRQPCRSADRLYLFSDRTLAELIERAGYEVTDIGQGRMPVDLSLGPLRSWFDHPLRLVCATVLAPASLIGPWLGSGDWVCLSASRPA